MAWIKSSIACLLAIFLFISSHGRTIHQQDTSKLPKIQWDELNPRAVGFVKDYLEIHEARLTNMKVWGQPYFIMIESVLNRYHLPPSLKYLAVIESDLKSTALSVAGAVGPWQFMPGTAKDLGLIVTPTRDDRMDLYKSTHAAAKFLSQLYEQLGDWLLVVAAYNGGPARVESIIASKKSRDFWMIQQHLPAESRNHVKKFIATHYIFERNGSETTGMKKADEKLPVLTAEELSTTDTISITGRYASQVITKNLAVDLIQFNKWNPDFDKKVALENYSIRLPKEKIILFNQRKNQIAQESILLIMQQNLGAGDGFPEPVKLPAPVRNMKPVKKRG
jgi:membrane-bound lytic murein transglycosylase D